MTPNDSNSNHSRINSSEQSTATDSVLANLDPAHHDPANHDPGVSRREFVGMTAASLLMARTLSSGSLWRAR